MPRAGVGIWIGRVEILGSFIDQMLNCLGEDAAERKKRMVKYPLNGGVDQKRALWA